MERAGVHNVLYTQCIIPYVHCSKDWIAFKCNHGPKNVNMKDWDCHTVGLLQ
jgi:hypothetical protein